MRAILWATLFAAVPLQAEPLTVPCRLPTSGRFLLTIEQRGWSADGKPWDVKLVQPVRIDRDGGMIRLMLDPTRAMGQLDEAGKRRLGEAFSADAQTPKIFRLAETGAIIGMDGLDAQWERYLARIEHVAADLAAAGKSTDRARAMLASLRASDERTRLGLLAGNAGPLLRHCGQSVDATHADDERIAIDQRMDSPAVSEVTHYLVDARTGLTRAIERRVTVAAQADKPQLESWHFDPAD